MTFCTILIWKADSISLLFDIRLSHYFVNLKRPTLMLKVVPDRNVPADGIRLFNSNPPYIMMRRDGRFSHIFDTSKSSKSQRPTLIVSGVICQFIIGFQVGFFVGSDDESGLCNHHYATWKVFLLGRIHHVLDSQHTSQIIRA